MTTITMVFKLKFNGDGDGNNGSQGKAPGESTDDGKFTIVGCYPVQQCTMCRLSGSIFLQEPIPDLPKKNRHSHLKIWISDF